MLFPVVVYCTFADRGSSLFKLNHSTISLANSWGRDELFDDVAGDISQAEIATLESVRQPLMVEPE